MQTWNINFYSDYGLVYCPPPNPAILFFYIFFKGLLRTFFFWFWTFMPQNWPFFVVVRLMALFNQNWFEGFWIFVWVLVEGNENQLKISSDGGDFKLPSRWQVCGGWCWANKSELLRFSKWVKQISVCGGVETKINHLEGA